MKKVLLLIYAHLLFFTVCPLGAQTVVQTFYVDFGENNVSDRGNLTTSPDTNGHYWTNVYSSPSERCYPDDWTLVNSENETTAYILQIGTYFHTNGMSGGGGLTSPSADLLGDLAIATATQDYIHVETFQDYNVINFRRLDTSKAYRFNCFGSRVVDEDRGGTFEFHGENYSSFYMQMSGSAIGDNGYNGNNNTIMSSDPVFPDKDGNIAMIFVKKYKSGMIYLNCMKIEELSGMERPNQDLYMTQKMLIDFGETDNSSRGHQTIGADTNGNYWNNLSSGASSSNYIPQGTVVPLVNTDNAATSYSMTALTELETNGVDAGGLSNPPADYLGDLAVETATEDYVWIDDTSTRKISFPGLDPGKCYKFYIFGSRSTSETDRRISYYQVSGQEDWSTNLTTSGMHVGGYEIHGNNRNIAISDYIFPSADGTIVFSCKKNTDMSTSHAHFNAIKIEEYAGRDRPDDPLSLATAFVTGSATETGSEVQMTEIMPEGTSTGIFESYQMLQPGTFAIKGITASGEEITLGDDGEGNLVEGGSTFEVADSQVVRLRMDVAQGLIEVTPVELFLKGNIVLNGTTVAYAGNGVFSQEVDMTAGTVTLFSDKYFYFAFNNDNDLAVQRLSGSRTSVAMPSEGFSTENIRINGGTYTITLDMTNYTWDVSAPIDNYKISAFGSSVCNGQGAENYQGYAYLYNNQLASRYKTGASEYPFTVSGVSIGGNTTVDLLNRYDEMLHDFGKYVIIGLSMGNEGIHEASDQQAIFSQFRDNMQTLISQMREDGKTVVVMNNYARGDYNESDYNYIKQMNLLIHQWDLPSVNTLGAIDNGSGQWATGFESDTSHPTTAGHRQFMMAIPASLFDALEQGKALPERDTAGSTVLEDGSVIQFSGETTVNPFAVSVRIKGSEPGEVVSFATKAGTRATVSILDGGYIQYTGISGATITSSASLITDDDTWHYITLTGYYAQKRTLLYCDNTCIGEVSERVTPGTFTIGDEAQSLNRAFSELFFWRSALNEMEVEALVSGMLLKSSLDIYSPLSDGIKAGSVANLAQSLNEASYIQGNVAERIGLVPSTSDSTPAYYSVNGIRQAEAQRGINIVKDNKSVMKQLVK